MLGRARLESDGQFYLEAFLASSLGWLWERAYTVKDARKTWQYFAQAVIQEEDPEKLTYLMQQLYFVLKDNEEQPIRAF
jgi:hypothetical protein